MTPEEAAIRALEKALPLINVAIPGRDCSPERNLITKAIASLRAHQEGEPCGECGGRMLVYDINELHEGHYAKVPCPTCSGSGKKPGAKRI